MPLAVLPALAPDIPAVYDVYFSAFGGDIILNALFGGADVTDPKFRIAHSESTKEWWNHVSHQYTAKCVDTRTNEIVGMAIVELYLQERTEEEYKIPGAVWLEGEAREKAEAILRPLWNMREKLWGGRPYICKCHSWRLESE